MSEARFLRCVRLVLDVEAGWADHPADHGGPTMRGITERTFREAIARGILPAGTKHRDLTADQARLIFRKFYWEPARCDDFPAPLDLLLLDAYVNHRPGPAVQLLQRALRVEDDGIIGPATIAGAMANPRPSLVVARYIVAREDFYEQIVRNEPSQAAFIRGWKNRLVVIHREAMKDLAA
jgi:lysozyme family protein